MCELMGMSANVPTDICFSFAELMQHGGGTGPHKDGWGIAFYEGKAIREFRDDKPSVDSEVAQLVKNCPIKSHVIISHIRQANSGRVCLENTHPFRRELWGRHWTLAHNGQLKGVKQWSTERFQPVGTTDSEHAFCWLMNQLADHFDSMPRSGPTLWRFLKSRCDELAAQGVCNLLFSDSQYLYAYCTTQLHWITRCAPFGEARLMDADITINFKHETTPDCVVKWVATQPLTDNETWNKVAPNRLLVFKAGNMHREILN